MLAQVIEKLYLCKSGATHQQSDRDSDRKANLCELE